MKRLVILLCAAIIAALFPVSVCAASNTVSFTLDDAECQSNRLVELKMNAQGDSLLCAAMFTFRFDNALLEFRKATALGGASVACKADGGTLKLSYLCAAGANIASRSAVFTLTFMANGEGSAEIGYTVSECVGSDAQYMPVGSCAAGRVTVSGKSASSGTDKSTKTTSGSSSRSSKAGTGSSKSSRSKSSKTESDAEDDYTHIDNKGTVNSVIQQDSDKLTPLIMLCVSPVIAAVLIGLLIRKVIADRKIKQRQEEDGESEP